MEIEISWLGRIPYAKAWTLQKSLVAARHASRVRPRDTLLLLEHPPVYTLGRSADEGHLLMDHAQREREGIAVHHVDRGGDITYHGPGQLVGYPILDLPRLHGRASGASPDLHRYLRDLEEVLITALATFHVAAFRFPGYTGVWVEGGNGKEKIAAIGVKVSSKGVTSHGFALNVDPNLDHFAGIVPCGIADHGVTSLARVLEHPLDTVDLVAPVSAAFERVFQVRGRFVSPIPSAYNQTGAHAKVVPVGAASDQVKSQPEDS
jgi:lipoate-protein ligase B